VTVNICPSESLTTTHQDGIPLFPVPLKMGIDKPSTPVQQHVELFPVKKKKMHTRLLPHLLFPKYSKLTNQTTHICT